MIFTPYSLGSLHIKNRCIKDGTLDFSAQPNGFCSESYTGYLENIARGGVGLICTAPASIQPDFRMNQYQLSIATQEAAESYKSLIDTIHAYDAKIFLFPQYNHQVLIDFVLSLLHPEASYRTKALKDVETLINSGLTGQEITDILQLYREAIKRAKQAGFDGIFLNGTIGSFFETISSRLLNRRTDEWGGSAPKRLNAMKQILAECRDNDLPVIVRWNVKDYEPDGVSIEESIESCHLLQEYGANLIELSAFCSVKSMLALNKDLEERETLPLSETHDLIDYYRIMHSLAQNNFFATREKEIQRPLEYVWGHAHYNIKPIKESLTIPVSFLGGVRSLKSAEKLIKAGICECISFLRTLVYDPHQCRKFEEGVSEYSLCISCNCCTYKAFSAWADPTISYLHRCVLQQG